MPAILEYIPYRKDDGTAARDALMHPWWAGHGYANVRVDQRGSGDSDGIILDEYTQQEHDDALEVLAWLAAQPWCTGKVGIIGKSWGGFNGLQIAARRPPELAGVISVASTDDRYATDIHYIGGALHGFQKQSWASTMLAYNARPPDPAVRGRPLARDVARAARPDAAVPARVGLASAPRRRSGSTARCARTTRTSRCRCTWSAAGRTATPTPSSASWRDTAPAENLPFDSDEFDSALAQLVVHFMTDPVAGLREMGRVTRQGGLVAACVWDHAPGGSGPLSLFWEATHQLDPGSRGESYMAGTGEGDLATLFAEAGISSVEDGALTFEVEHASFEEWWEPYTLGVGPVGVYVDGLDEAGVERLREACRALLPPAPFTLSIRAWAARGRA